MGVVLINNLMKDANLSEKLIFEGQEMKNCLNSKDEERIRYALYIILNNILISFRTLKNTTAQNLPWISTEQNTCSSKKKALICLENIIGYFPEI